MTPDFTDRIAPLQQRVEGALESLLPPPSQSPQRLHEAMRHAVLGGGKRLRAVLVYAAAEAVGQEEPEGVDGPAAAVELIHAYSLVHDDLPAMDDDDWRRGKPTCHRAFGEATAILAGDALQSLAFLAVAGEPGQDPEAEANRAAMVRVLAEASGAAGMAGGQALDLDAVGRELDADALEAMHARKTGALIAAAVRIGAIAAGCRDAASLDALARYGRAIGLAFQIHDDVLDVDGDPSVLGKQGGADAARGKPTYPSLLGVERARALARERSEEAVRALTEAPGLGSVEWLERLARYCVERDR